MSAPGAPYVLGAIDGISALTIETVVCGTLPAAARAYAELKAKHNRPHDMILYYSEDGHDIDTDGLESEECEAIESGDPDFARRTLREMGWDT
jgi:hypothetical protein